MLFFSRKSQPTPVISNMIPRVRMRIDPALQRVSKVSSAGVEGSRTKSDAPEPGFESVLQSARAGKEPASAEGRWVEYTIKENDTLWNLAVKRFHVNLADIVRDNAIEDPNRIRPGQKIRIRIPSYPESTEVVASWYGKGHHGRRMADGQKYNMHAATIAHKDLPLGTRVELENPETRQRVKAVVTDRGPYVDGRDVDLSYDLARRLSLLEKGVGPLVMRVLG